MLATEVAFLAAPAASAVLVEARSSAGPISFGTTTVGGWLRASLADGTIDTRYPTAAEILVPVASLTSGNRLYDAELCSRLNARQFPNITAELHTITPLDTNRFGVYGALTIQGTTREFSSSLELSVSDSGTARVTGQQLIDIRDFAIELPSMMMFKIFPDVTVQFSIQAVQERSEDLDNGGSQ